MPAVLLDDVRPDLDLLGVTVNALEDEAGTSASWSVTAYAICANQVAAVRTPASSALDSSGSRVVSAPCRPGQKLTNVSGDINTFNGQIVLDSVFPNADLTSAGMAAFEDRSGNQAAWSITVYGICAETAERVQVTGPGRTSFRLRRPECPAKKWPTGLGGEIGQARGQASMQALSPDPTGVLASQWSTATGSLGVGT